MFMILCNSQYLVWTNWKIYMAQSYLITNLLVDQHNIDQNLQLILTPSIDIWSKFQVHVNNINNWLDACESEPKLCESGCSVTAVTRNYVILFSNSIVGPLRDHPDRLRWVSFPPNIYSSSFSLEAADPTVRLSIMMEMWLGEIVTPRLMCLNHVFVMVFKQTIGTTPLEFKPNNIDLEGMPFTLNSLDDI